MHKNDFSVYRSESEGAREKRTRLILEDNQIDIELGHAYHIALEDKDINTSRLANRLCQELKTSIVSNEWLEQLQKEDWMIDLVIELVNQDYKPNLDNKFMNALVNHARLLLEGKVKVEILKESWSKLLDGLSEAERDQYKRKLLDILISARVSILPLITLYNIEIENAIKNTDKQTKKEFISQTCIKIADRNNKDEQQWMLTLLKSDPSLIKSTTRNSKEALRNRLKPFLDQEYTKLKNGQTESAEASTTSDIEKDWLIVIKDVAKQLEINLEQEQDDKEKNDGNEINLEKDNAPKDT